MRSHLLTAVFKIAVLTVLLALFLGHASAATPQGGLSISPTSFDQQVDPGGTYHGSLLVLNQGTTNFSYTVYASPYSVTGEDYTPEFTPEPGAPDVTKWFSFGVTSGTLQAGTQVTVPYTITVPANTPAGSYYAVTFAQTTSQKSSNSITVQKRVGTIFYLRVSGAATLKGNVESWSVQRLQQYPLTATLRMGNTGSLNYRAQVKTTFSDIFGGTKYQFSRSPEILPQKIRKIPIPWENGAHFGLFKVSGTVAFNGTTHHLATRYVFIASGVVRLVMIGIFLLFVAAMIVLGKRRAARK